MLAKRARACRLVLDRACMLALESARMSRPAARRSGICTVAGARACGAVLRLCPLSQLPHFGGCEIRPPPSEQRIVVGMHRCVECWTAARASMLRSAGLLCQRREDAVNTVEMGGLPLDARALNKGEAPPSSFWRPTVAAVWPAARRGEIS